MQGVACLQAAVSLRCAAVDTLKASHVWRPGVDKSAYHAVACEYMKVRVRRALLLFFHVSNLHPSQSIIFSFLLQTQTVYISLEVKVNVQCRN